MLCRCRFGSDGGFEGDAVARRHQLRDYRFRIIVEPAALLEPGYQVDAEAFALHRRQQESLLHGNIVLLSRGELFRYGAEFHEMIVACSATPIWLMRWPGSTGCAV